MKYKNRLKKLERRQKAYVEKPGTKRPGSRTK